MSTIVNEFDVKVDDRKRVPLKEAAYEHYHVVAYDDGHYELRPQLMIDATVARRTLAMMDEAMENFRDGRVGAALDVEHLEALADSSD